MAAAGTALQALEHQPPSMYAEQFERLVSHELPRFYRQAYRQYRDRALLAYRSNKSATWQRFRLIEPVKVPFQGSQSSLRFCARGRETIAFVAWAGLVALAMPSRPPLQAENTL